MRSHSAPGTCFRDGRPWCRYAATNAARLRRGLGDTARLPPPVPSSSSGGAGWKHGSQSSQALGSLLHGS